MIAHLESLRTELATLSASAAHYRLLIEEVEQRQATVQATLDAVIFPILTLPPEVTTEIFLHCAVATLASRHDLGPPPKDILNLTGICRRWRNLALSIPRLWSTLNLDNLWHVAQEELAAVTDSWFSRAGALPLRLQWMGDVESETQESSETNAVLRRYAPRLQGLSLSVTSGRVCDLNDTLSFPLLQHLNLTTFGGASPSPAPPILAFRATPRLRHLHIYGISPPSLIGIRWELLESLVTSSVPPQKCLDVLRNAPSLLRYDFYGSYNNSYDADQGDVLHPRLTTLSLLGGDHEMMRYLTFPSLRELSLHLPHLDDGVFVQFLSRSRGELRNFEMTTNVVLSLSWFHHMMHLTILTLGELQVDSAQNLVRALNRHREHSFLPALETLTLKNWKSDQLDMQLVDTLASRSTAQEAKDDRPALTKLKSFKFLWTQRGRIVGTGLADMASLIRNFSASLRGLERQGMKLYIGTGDKNCLELF
ncbi:hypothetical protein C8R46DRAFT_1191797 [Mycena filopes]|nr:hypothetical protein C8R46DRAFT_1191797 [Mycena filopes]